MQKNILVRLLLVLGVALLNYWIWRIFKYNAAIAILGVVTSLLVYAFFVTDQLKTQLRYLVILIILTLVQVFFIKSDINFKIEDEKPSEILQRHEREYFYTQDLGKIFLNKISLNYYYNYDLFFQKAQRNLFYLLDINQYFFAGHPRERERYEFEKYSFISLPFFIIGFLWLLFKIKLLQSLYILIVLFVSIFINPGFHLGPILIFPIINYLISLGLITTITKIKK